MDARIPFSTFCFALVICKNEEGKYLGVKETRNRGWWIPGGLVEPGEDFFKAAKRETKEEAGIDIEITGILRVEHSVQAKSTARMRVIFFALPRLENIKPKSKADEHSESASWLSIEEISSLRTRGLIRGDELYSWPNYIEKGGMIAPISFFSNEDDDPNNLTIDQVCRFSRKASSGKKAIEETKILSSQEEFRIFLSENKLENLRKILSEETIDINYPVNDKNWSPLIISIKKKFEEMVSILLIMKANLFVCTHKKRNCVHFAVQSNLSIFSLILLSINFMDEESKLKLINQQDIFGDTPLHIAAFDIINDNNVEFRKKIYNSLLSAGARLDIKNLNDLSPEKILQKKLIKTI